MRVLSRCLRSPTARQKKVTANWTMLTGDRIRDILLAVIGALLLFLLNDFNQRLRVVEENVYLIRGGLSGPLRPMPGTQGE